MGEQYTDSEGRSFHYERGQRVYVDGSQDLGAPVAFTPTFTPPYDENPDIRPLQAKHLELAQAIQDAGFVALECAKRDDKLACMSPAKDHGFYVALRSDHWFIWEWAGRYYRGQGTERLKELCLLLLRNPPGLNTAFMDCSEYPLPKNIQDQFALEELEDTDEGLGQELWPGMEQRLAERFGFRRYTGAEEGKRPGLPQARAAMDEHWKKSVPVRPEEVLVNDDLIYIPSPYYMIGGPEGFLFERSTGRALTVSYPFLPEAVIWAYYHGFSWHDARRWGTVTIKAVHLPKWARSEVSTYERQDSTIQELAKHLSNPPFVLRDVEPTMRFAWLLFEGEQLGDCFEFEIVPTRTEPGAPLNGGSTITLKCRTPEEAYLVCKELEKLKIVTILPEKKALLLDYSRKGYVEVRVSAKPGESHVDLTSTFELQCRRVRAEQPLPAATKAVGMVLAVIMVPGVLLYAWLLTNYRENGYDRMAKELKLWFRLGVAAWIIVIALASCFELGSDRKLHVGQGKAKSSQGP